jgi:hypothetical protein
VSKFNVVDHRVVGKGPVQTAGSTVNHEGAAAYVRDVKSELFLLAVTNFVGEGTFYESADARDERYRTLVAQAAIDDPVWTVELLRWLRSDGNLRSASLVGAAEFVHARLAAKAPSVPAYEVRGLSDDRGLERVVVDVVLQRADEPGEMLAYWTSTYGRTIPKPVKRGVADAAARLYSEYSLLKYDTASKGYRFADVLDLVHPTPKAPWQGELFKYALDRRHNRDLDTFGGLTMVQASEQLRSDVNVFPEYLLDAEKLKAAGFTWEDALSLAGSKVDKAKLWSALIPSMGYQALLRNLRNFDEAGVPDEVADQVAARLADPEQVAKSRQFPFRFYAAYTAVQSLRWGNALEKALRASLANVPVLDGRTLILVDQSPSMFPGYYYSTQAARKDISNADLAKLFGSALALRAADATLVGYGTRSYPVPFSKGEAVLKLMGKFRMDDGTDTFGAAAAHFARHDRVVIVTDEQNQTSRYRTIDDVVPRNVPVYTWNVGGYRPAAIATTGNRHTFAGLTDAAFRLVPLLEAGRSGSWPWV